MPTLRLAPLSLLVILALSCAPAETPVSTPELTKSAPPTAAPAPPPTSAQRVPAGKRATLFSLPLSQVAFGSLAPGDEVDVLATFEVELEGDTPRKSWVNLVLLQQRKVLDVFPLRDGKVSFSLALNTEEAMLLASSSDAGPLTFLVCSPDAERSPSIRWSWHDAVRDLELLHDERQKRSKPEPSKPGVLLANMRRFALPLELPPEAIASFQPGDRIDLLGTFGDDARTLVESRVSMTLLQDVAVLEVHPERGGLNLAVTLREAQLLSHAAQRGVLTPRLRNPQEREVERVQRQALHEALLDLEFLLHPRFHRSRRKISSPRTR